MSRAIVMASEVHREPKLVKETISTREGLAAFWTPDVQGDHIEGGELTFGFAQAPTRLPMRVTGSTRRARSPGTATATGRSGATPT